MRKLNLLKWVGFTIPVILTGLFTPNTIFGNDTEIKTGFMQNNESNLRDLFSDMDGWTRFDGVTVKGETLVVSPIDRKIRPKTSGKWYFNPPINLCGPKLLLKGDFAVRVDLAVPEESSGYAYFDLYGTVPIGYDEWRIDGKWLRIGIKDGVASVWVNMIKQKFSKKDLSVSTSIVVERSGAVISFYSDGKIFGSYNESSSTPVFPKNEMYIGAEAEKGGGFVIEGLTANGVTIADNYKEMIRMYPIQSDSLRAYASRLAKPFWIGTCGNADALLSDPQYGKVLAEQFNMITPEMCMKFQAIHPVENEFAFAEADALVEFARLNNMRMRGHCLVWHEALPLYVWDVYKSGNKDKLHALLMDHVTKIVTRYKGKIKEWDTLNEIFSSDFKMPKPNNPYALRGKAEDDNNPSIWYNTFGYQIYIDVLLKVKEIDPACENWINEFGTDQAIGLQKVENMIGFVKMVNGKYPGLIDGIGFQAHNYNPIEDPSVASECLANMQKVSDEAGVNVRISELDVSDASENPGLFEDKLDICTDFVKNPRCRSLGMWGFTDRYTSFSGPTNEGELGTNYKSPNWGASEEDVMIYDSDFVPKEAWVKMRDLLKSKVKK